MTTSDWATWQEIRSRRTDRNELVVEGHRDAMMYQTTLQCPACSGDMFYAEDMWKCSECGEEVE